MRIQLVPGLLAAQTIEYDDAHHKLIVGLHLVPLSATQYTLVMALLRQYKRWDEDTSGTIPRMLTVQQLQQIGRLPTPTLVKQHLHRATSRLAAHAWLIVCLHGYGYAIFPRSEVLAGSPSPFGVSDE